jgi:hypothetical protein
MSSTLLLPPRAQLCNRSCSNKHTHSPHASARRPASAEEEEEEEEDKKEQILLQDKIFVFSRQGWVIVYSIPLAFL